MTRRSLRHSHRCEALEFRRLLAVNFDQGVLRVRGTEGNDVISVEFNEEQTRASRDAIERFLERTGAQLWIQHDLTHHRTLKKSPQYYE